MSKVSCDVDPKEVDKMGKDIDRDQQKVRLNLGMWESLLNSITVRDHILFIEG